MSIITIAAITLGVPYNWPDNYHVRHGFPLVWGTHTLSTIAGPADIWSVSVAALVIDLILWLGLMGIVQIISQRMIQHTLD
ncbi:MAG: hypothetical protein JSV18_03670 [Candidatus Bathyarchaeota archaeon]|nr:MAG: hypothetical protein JSV18_03670 [Candidatus Bathyarchaeota archaeon]